MSHKETSKKVSDCLVAGLAQLIGGELCVMVGTIGRWADITFGIIRGKGVDHEAYQIHYYRCFNTNGCGPGAGNWLC